MAVGRLSIELTANPSVLINGLGKAEAAVNNYEQSVNRSIGRSASIINGLSGATSAFSTVATSAFDNVINSLSAISTQSDITTAKLLSNLDATASGLVDGVGSFHTFQEAATDALGAIISIAPTASASLAALAGPVGLIAGAIGAGVIAYQSYNSVVTENNAKIQANTDKLAAQLAEAGRLFGELKSGNSTLRDKKTVMEEINSKYGTTLRYMEDEKKLAGQIKAAYEGVVQQIKIKVALQANDEKLTALQKEINSNNELINIYKQQLDYAKQFGDVKGGGGSAFNLTNQIKSLESANKDLETQFNKIVKNSSNLNNSLADIRYTPSGSSRKGTSKKPTGELGIDDQVLTVFANMEQQLQKVRQSFDLIPNDVKVQMDLVSAEINILEDALTKLSLYGLTPADNGIIELQDSLGVAKIKLDLLKDSTDKAKQALSDLEAVPERGYFLVEDNNNSKLTTSHSSAQQPSLANRLGLNFDYEGGDEKLTGAAAGIGLGVDVASTNAVREAVAALNKEMLAQQAIVNDATATNQQKKAAEEQIELIRRQIAEEKKKGDVAQQVTRQVYNAVRDRVKAYIAEGIAGLISKEIASKGIIGLATAAAGSALAVGLFDKLIPKLAVGTDYVNRGGLAILHQGESVVPADVKGGGYTRSDGGPIDVNVHGSISSFGIMFSNTAASEKYLRLS